MLLNFKCINFRSFRDEMNFTMIPSRKRMHNEFIIEKDYKKSKKIKALPVTVIYGANASGKTNIMLGMKLLKDIILSGRIDDKKIMTRLEVSRFIHDIHFYEPIEFEILFLHEDSIFKYGLKIGNEGSGFEILNEYLYIDDNEVFMRESKKIKMQFEKLKKLKYVEDNSTKYYWTLLESVNNNQEEKQLFLSNGLKVIFNKEFYNNIVEWFNKFNIIMDVDEIEFQISESEKHTNNTGNNIENKEKYYEIQTINQVVELAEFGDQKIKFFNNNDNDKIEMVSSYGLPNKNMYDSSKFRISMVVNSEAMESKGTIQLLKLVQPFVKVLKNGGIIALDEMDASLHFEIIVSLIRVFNNKMINKNGAQLIFNTHNPIYLDGELLRHDQIMMVRKSQETLTSEAYYLVDYGLRPEEKILKNYLNGKYGALPQMDLEIAFKKILDEEVIQCE